MTNTAKLLEEHNELAAKIGANKLKAWKGSKKDLEDRVEGFKRQLPKAMKKDEAEKAIKKAQKPEKDDTMISVSDVAAEINMNAKVARAKLRRKGQKSNEGRWPTFKRDSKEHTDLIAFLKGKA